MQIFAPSRRACSAAGGEGGTIRARGGEAFGSHPARVTPNSDGWGGPCGHGCRRFAGRAPGRGGRSGGMLRSMRRTLVGIAGLVLLAGLGFGARWVWIGVHVGAGYAAHVTCSLAH